ncbi:hypothetical protein FJT64_017016 [Amphibalanus amphitrite]|uniref:Uncharacterized protein n=1 Tax=Amphibalanus amphitrite TaxID=1232801 RepID=A0A6A4X7S4_AMPAM|nr:hypothetical protein FJT64_017016 [Amphibalanus amphitrite]
MKESYVPPQPASPEVVFPPDGERAPWHPDPRQKPSQPLVVSGSAPQPGAGRSPHPYQTAGGEGKDIISGDR